MEHENKRFGPDHLSKGNLDEMARDNPAFFNHMVISHGFMSYIHPDISGVPNDVEDGVYRTIIFENMQNGIITEDSKHYDECRKFVEGGADTGLIKALDLRKCHNYLNRTLELEKTEYDAWFTNNNLPEDHREVGWIEFCED